MTQRLLFADDSLTMHRVVEITFGQEDVYLVAAHSGAEALTRAVGQDLDVALLDVELGDMDGYALCTKLQAARSTPLPVLLLVSDQHPVDEARLKACGAVGSVKKPFDTQTLIAQVRKAGSMAAPARATEAPAVQHVPPRPAFFTPPPVPAAAPQTVPDAAANPWAVATGGPPSLPEGAPAGPSMPPTMPNAQDLPELPQWSVTTAELAAPKAQAEAAIPAHEPLWTEREASTAEDLRRPEVDPGLIEVARADAQRSNQTLGTPPLPSPPPSAASSHETNAASVQATTQAALARALGPLVAQWAQNVSAKPGQGADAACAALAQALTPVLIETIERVAWDVLPAIVLAHAQAQPPSGGTQS